MSNEPRARAVSRASHVLFVPLASLLIAFAIAPAALAQSKAAVWSPIEGLQFHSAPASVQAAVKSSVSNAPKKTNAATKGFVASKPKAKAKAKGIKVASLGSGAEFLKKTKPGKSLSGGGGVQWVASAKCLAGNLRAVVYHVAKHYGSVRVNSTCRSKGHNRKIGGASKSWHLTGNAVDLRVFGNVAGAAAYLRTAAGGYKHYGGGLFHVDNGPRRTW